MCRRDRCYKGWLCITTMAFLILREQEKTIAEGMFLMVIRFQFSEFYDPDLNQSTTLPTFFIYRHVFFNDVIVSVFHIYIFK